MSSSAADVCRLRGHGTVARLLADVREDIDHYARRSLAAGEASGAWASLSTLLTPSLGAVVLHRLAHFLHANHWLRAARLASWANLLVHKTTITPSSCVDGGLFLPHPIGLVFHGRAGKGLTLFANVICGPIGPIVASDVQSGPLFGHRVSVGVHAAVLGAVQVGDDARIGYRVVLREDAPAGCLIASGRSRVRIDPPL